jgi:acyl-CoA reductase-like NAD-dependent aldehyde dehydrogenase
MPAFWRGSTSLASDFKIADGAVRRHGQEALARTGSNAPFIVFDDADFEAAVKGAIASKHRNASQT